MLKIISILFALSLFINGVKDARGQVGVDEMKSGWQLGSHRGSVHLRISEKEQKIFAIFMEEFAVNRSFVKINSANGPVLDDREFISDWYRRLDGVTIFVTNITAPEKMRVIFYDKKGGEGTTEAEQAFLEFKSISSRFRRYE